MRLAFFLFFFFFWISTLRPVDSRKFFFSPARIWSQSARNVRPQGDRGMSQVFNLFLHHHDGGRGASNYKDLRGGTRCAVTDSDRYFIGCFCKV